MMTNSAPDSRPSSRSEKPSAGKVEKASRPPRKPVVGVVGGGQLAWMLAQAAIDLGVDLNVQTPHPEDPAAGLAAKLVLADLEDWCATRTMAQGCTAISFENEWLQLAELEQLRDEGVRFLPSLESLGPLISKRAQRELLDRLHLPCPRWCPLNDVLIPMPVAAPPLAATVQDPMGQSSDPNPTLDSSSQGRKPSAPRLPEGFRFPLMAKAVNGGYDGKGTIPLKNQGELEALLAHVDPIGWILEEMVAFDQELAMVACRDQRGKVACFPLVETHQHQRVCEWVVFPASANHATRAFAHNVAASLLTALDYVGVMGIEFFYGHQGMQVNELAPRTHNSGHLTIEACSVSQFEQQVRIVAGLPMGSTDPIVLGALMVNLLGFESAVSDYVERRHSLAALPGASLYWYGKRKACPGRKLGHLTVLLESEIPAERQIEVNRRLAEIRKIWPLPQKDEQSLK